MRTQSEIFSTYERLSSRYLAGNATVGEDVARVILEWVLDPTVPDIEMATLSDETVAEGWPDNDRLHEECCPADGSCCDEVHCERDRQGKCSHCTATHCGIDSACIPLTDTGVPLIPDIDALRALWVGKYVRTERVLSRDEFQAWMNYPPDKDLGAGKWREGYTWGGAGIVVGFRFERGGVWLDTDEGMTWRIDAQTTITDAIDFSARRPGTEDYRKPCGCTLTEGCWRCCQICNVDAHRCPGCGEPTNHEWLCCPECRTPATKAALA